MKQRLIFTAVMSLTLCFFMTLWVTWINLGFNSDFILQWLRAFGLAWPVAAVVSFVTGPFVQTLSAKLAD
ncbi:DUF2798 domain-containing protein [Terasakiella sp. A23]|uniref:DUF2798 domain-containing protein n=1 Tax=Terasakiella sp. FCG-A23 TaxID=3080561 RepID=UPI0029538D5B|nr:DUF2798 domain-containing protein [Terasakiella sp. A23]MDV7340137.1 DUF2798 domain-containing protein [Terasakiella sp. A23]